MKQLILLLLIVCANAAFARPRPTPSPTPAAISGLTLFEGTTRIGPFPGSVLTSGVNYTVKVDNATNTVTVKFYRDGGLILTDTAAPFSVGWTPNVIGQHTFMATGLNSAGHGNSINTTFSVVRANLSPSPTTTPTPTLTPTPTATSTPSPSPSPTPTATPIPTATPTPTATPKPTPSPSLTPTPTPSNTRTVTVEIVSPTVGDTYQIYYGTEANNYGQPVAILAGGVAVDIPGLTVGTQYFFANQVRNPNGVSAMSSPVPYTVTTAKTQRITVP